MSDCEPFDSRDLIPRIERLEKIASILAVSRYNEYNKTSCKNINEVKQHSFVNESIVDDFISAVLSEVKKPKRSVTHVGNISCLESKPNVSDTDLKEVQCVTCDRWFFTSDQKNKCKHCS